MSDRASYREKLIGVETDVRALEASGLRLYGAGDLISETILEFERPLEIAVVTGDKNAQAPSVFSDDDSVTITVLDSEYGGLADAGLPTADMLILETSARLNQDSISRWEVALRLAKPDIFVGVLQTGAEILDPLSFDAIAAANQADCNRVFGKDLQYFTATPNLADAVFSREEREKLALLASGAILLEKRITAAQRHQRQSLAALEEMLRARVQYDDTLKDLRFKGGQVQWDQMLKTKVETVMHASDRELFKALARSFKAYNGGKVYRSVVDHLRNRKKRVNPRNREQVEQLGRDLLYALMLSAQSAVKEIVGDHESVVNDGFFTAVEAVTKMISASYVIDEARLEMIEGEEIDTEMPDLVCEIDTKQARVPTFQIVKTLILDAISGAVLGAVAAGSLTGEPLTTTGVAILAALAKMGYAGYGIYETERASFENIVESQMIVGMLRDAETLLRDELEVYVSTFREKVNAAVEEAIALIASELEDALDFYNRMLNATQEELRCEIEDVKTSIDKLDALVEKIRLIPAEEPAASGSEAVAA